METIMNWQKIKEVYPDEWVVLVDFINKENKPYGDVEGKVIIHHKNEILFTELLKKTDLKSLLIDIRYTGDVLPENPIGPILWQISPANS